MLTDPISDLFVQIKMGLKARKATVTVNSSKLKTSVLALLKAEGFIENFESQTNNKINKTIIKLKYRNGNPSINGLKQISKPGLRVYVPAEKLPRILNGLGIAIVSTSRGLMSDYHARKLNIGGEIIGKVW